MQIIGCESQVEQILQKRKNGGGVLVVVEVGKEDTQQLRIDEDEEDLQCVRQFQRVLELLWKNWDMLFSEVKLTVMTEDPREVERRRLLGIEDPDAPTRDDLVDTLEQGYGALYLVTAFPVIIGISVLLILFYNSLR
ncbi:hypothetical protein CRYUN_Cryun06bG0000500 [Craigia yunnanensis]